MSDHDHHHDPVPAGLTTCIGLLALPIAFQLAATVAYRMPEGFWMLMVLSIWASLAVGLLTLAFFLRAVFALAGRRRVQRGFRSSHCRI